MYHPRPSTPAYFAWPKPRLTHFSSLFDSDVPKEFMRGKKRTVSVEQPPPSLPRSLHPNPYSGVTSTAHNFFSSSIAVTA